MDSKRLMDLGLGSLALAASIPVFLAVAAAMRLSGDEGPFLYRARRVGSGGRPIIVLKIRTMRSGSRGSSLTTPHDTRVTHLGRLLRRYRIDELPQLVNVVRGDMSLVGPRPEDPAFVNLADPVQRRVLAVRPGITGPAQLTFRNEAALLAGPDVEARYRREILPAKLQIDADYAAHRSTLLDLRILGRTAVEVLR